MKVNRGIFRREDKVFDIRFGWGVVIEDSSNCGVSTIIVKFDFDMKKYYTNCGSLIEKVDCDVWEIRDLIPMLSFQKYNFNNFSQKRPTSDNFQEVLKGLNKLSKEEMEEMVKLLTNK